MQFVIKCVLAVCTSMLIEGQLQAQTICQDAFLEVEYEVSALLTTSEKHTPLWLLANRQGLSSVEKNNGYLRAKLFSVDTTLRDQNWHFSFGVDLVLPQGYTSHFVVQQLYAAMSYKDFQLSVGARERESEWMNNRLSSGAQTFGINARPIPQIRFEIPTYTRLLPKVDWLQVKGHFGYGYLTDGAFQERYVTQQTRYAQEVLYHSKAGYVKLEKKSGFPFWLEGGIEMAGLFGGRIYHYDKENPVLKLSSNWKNFVNVVYGGGSDPTDGNYKNVGGNMLGSLLLSVGYKSKNWKIRAYLDHFFEDHSMLLFQYGWKDGLYGIELTPPANPIFDAFVYEYITTKDQSGPIFHNKTPQLPYQISALDNYYNHGLYLGWQHWGQAIGNPLYYTPLYEKDGSLNFWSNRFVGHHFGISGDPLKNWSYRLLFSHTKSWGVYEKPYDKPKYQNSFLTEISYLSKSEKSLWKGWKLNLGIGYDQGTQHGKSWGVSLGVSKSGKLF